MANRYYQFQKTNKLVLKIVSWCHVLTASELSCPFSIFTETIIFKRQLLGYSKRKQAEKKVKIVLLLSNESYSLQVKKFSVIVLVDLPESRNPTGLLTPCRRTVDLYKH